MMLGKWERVSKSGILGESERKAGILESVCSENMG